MKQFTAIPRNRWSVVALVGLLALRGLADDEPGAPAAGHSLHGEAFDEGPRQSAQLMPGTGAVAIQVSTSSPEAQAFFNQGVGQLEGFWYFEAERSFRQAAALDTNCAMAYWGMAMANVHNTNRAAGFIGRACQLAANISPRELHWIEAYHDYFKGHEPDIEQRKNLIKALETIVQDYPQELEAKTFLAFQIWENETEGIPLTSRQALDALMNEVLAVAPLHPIHHARIHVWNGKKDERALNSAARSGQSAPAVAHMWHMAGHTFSDLKRYDDAAWQQEAAARTDHAYMMAARILPDQIHNFAHNNQWLCTDLLYCGRVGDAVELARNMIELPRHPKYNTLNRKEDHTAYDKNHGSSMLGRNRLLDAVITYELWSDLLTLARTAYLEPADLPEEEARGGYALALAHFAEGDTNAATDLVAVVDRCRQQLKQERFDAAERAETAAKKEKTDANRAMVKAMEGFNARLEQVEKYQTELKIWATLAGGQTNEARKLLEEARDLSADRRVRLWDGLADTTNTVKLAEEIVKASTNQAPGLALAAHLFWKLGETNSATDAFEQLRAISALFDLATPIFARLAPIAANLGLPADWRLPAPKRLDSGERPALETLGPFRWQPYEAPAWSLKDAKGQNRSLSDYRGRPVLVVFYLGQGCSHCLEQLNLLAPAAKEFQALGISIAALSTDSPEGLRQTEASAAKTGGFPFPLLSDPTLAAFKAYRAFDDFEQMALHGTFLVGGDGRVLWQDISYEPYTDLKFLVAESRRLLGLSKDRLLAGRVRQ